jgi:glycosyltransferase involved in cell wall biosynthesis
MLASADALVVNSETQHTTLSRDFGVSPVKCFLICDGVDQEGIAAAQPFSADAKIILYVGRLEHYKNVALGIHALEMLPKDFSYVIIGEGAFKQKLQHIAENKGLSSRVLLLGYQPDPIVWRWLRTADIFLHLSDVESFGMTCIESLAAGTPVVANDDGFGLSETIKLFPREIFAYRARKESVKDLANLIAHVATMKPVNADVSRFSWNHVANQMETVYRRLATANR